MKSLQIPELPPAERRWLDQCVDEDELEEGEDEDVFLDSGEIPLVGQEYSEISIESSELGENTKELKSYEQDLEENNPSGERSSSSEHANSGEKKARKGAKHFNRQNYKQQQEWQEECPPTNFPKCLEEDFVGASRPSQSIIHSSIIQEDSQAPLANPSSPNSSSIEVEIAPSSTSQTVPD